jgi:hypothetical protein
MLAAADGPTVDGMERNGAAPADATSPVAVGAAGVDEEFPGSRSDWIDVVAEKEGVAVAGELDGLGPELVGEVDPAIHEYV